MKDFSKYVHEEYWFVISSTKDSGRVATLSSSMNKIGIISSKIMFKNETSGLYSCGAIVFLFLLTEFYAGEELIL